MHPTSAANNTALHSVSLLSKMEINALIMRLLKLHFKDRLHILDGALVQLKEYSNNNSSTRDDYDSVSTTLKNVIQGLPDDILNYVLTLIPPPKNTENLSLNTCEVKNIKTLLAEYVKRESAAQSVSTAVIEEPKDEDCSNMVRKTRNSASNSTTASHDTNTETESIGGAVVTSPKKKLRAKRRSRSKPTQNCKKMQDICCEYVIRNYAELYQQYQTKNEEVWRLLNENNNFSVEEVNKFYEIGRDLNKKLRWLRWLEAEEITEEIILDGYYDENVLVKESDMHLVLTEDPFEINEVLENSIMNFVSKKI